jgi:hypothetical protein
MIRRILFTAATASALLAAVPAFAAEHADAKTTCSCCSDGSVHDIDHPIREGQKQKASSERNSAPAASDDLNARNQSFGG